MDSIFTHTGNDIGLLDSAMDGLASPEGDMRLQLRQKDMLLREMQHRMGNSLQIVASILLLKARTAQSEEARLHLRDAHGRVMSIAAVQKRLQVSPGGERIELGSYLSDLCGSLDDSMIGGVQPVSLEVHAERGTVSAQEAVCVGLIVTELVINALKHAFGQEQAECRISVAYEAGAEGWRLSVRDNGGRGSAAGGPKPAFGLGTSIVEALARQLGARVDIVRDATGYRTTIGRAGIG